MELMINLILGALGTIILGLITNYISDKIKNHSAQKSGFELEIKIKFKKSK